MRTISGSLFENDYKLKTPFRMLISGSSGTGKTTFIENLLKSNRIDKEFTTVYYCYPYTLGDPPVDWDQTLDCNIEYLTHLPDLCFFDTEIGCEQIYVETLIETAFNDNTKWLIYIYIYIL